jgi:molecular chaperone HscC
MIVGIDLGTTHSLIGVFGADGPQLIPNALGRLLTPSAVSLDAAGDVIVGQAARDRLVSHPEVSVATFKRWMGSAREAHLGKHRFRPEELSALVIRSLLQDAEAFLGARPTEAVISVPAYFGDAQRKATRAAGELAGIKVDRLINEPTAAALAYGLESRADGSTFIVLDLGGGTFDVSILELFEGVMQVHASCGDNHLGGEDFLRLLVDACCADLQVDRAALPRSELAHVHNRLEDLKNRLTLGAEATTTLQLGGETREWRVSEERFAKLADPLLQRIRGPVERAMRDARLTPAGLHEVVLVGGASRMPMLHRLVARMMGRLPLRHVSPDEAIARGACIAAGLKARDRALEEVVMTDVCPYTLGVEVSEADEHGNQHEGFFSPIIQRNATVPVSRVAQYVPVNDRQERIELNIFQGESPLVANNVRLGKLDVRLPVTGNRANRAVDVRFTYDINGVLQVEATVVGTGKKHELLLQNSAAALDPQQLRARLAELEAIKVHPRQVQENVAVVARAERLFEESLADRPTVQHWLARFVAALDSQDPDRIREQRQVLVAVLDELEARIDG